MVEGDLIRPLAGVGLGAPPEPGVFDHLAIRYDPLTGVDLGHLEPAIKTFCVTLRPSVRKKSLEPQELAESHRNRARTRPRSADSKRVPEPPQPVRPAERRNAHYQPVAPYAEVPRG